MLHCLQPPRPYSRANGHWIWAQALPRQRLALAARVADGQVDGVELQIEFAALGLENIQPEWLSGQSSVPAG